MTYERRTLLIIITLILLNIMCLFSGCALMSAADSVFNPAPKGQILPETAKGQLWQTIRGMTPNWMAIPVIALGGAAMWYGAFKLGMAFVIFGSINLFMALATSRFGFIMALCGLIGSIAAVISSMIAKNKALKEIIFGVQDIKQIAKGDNVDLVFQDKIKDTLSKQTKITKKIVQKIKAKL